MSEAIITRVLTLRCVCDRVYVCFRGIKEYEPARFMTVNQCIEQLLEVENERKEGGQSLSPSPAALSLPVYNASELIVYTCCYAAFSYQCIPPHLQHSA